MIHGQNQLFLWPFSIAMLNYRRVTNVTYWCVLSREWMGVGVAGMIIDSCCGSFPHSLLSTSKISTWCILVLGV